MGDAQNGQAPAPEPAPAPKPKWKKYVLLAVGVVLAGLVAQGYVPQAVVDTIMQILAGLGLAY